MTKKSLMIASAIILPLTVGVMAMGIGASNGVNYVQPIAVPSESSISFERDASFIQKKIDSSNYSITAYANSVGGTKVYSYNFAQNNISDFYSTAFCTLSDDDSYLVFSEDVYGTPFEFQSLSSITITLTSTLYNRNVIIYESDHADFSESVSKNILISGGSSVISLSGYRYLKITGKSGGSAFYIRNVSINQNCDSSYIVGTIFESNSYVLTRSGYATKATLSFNTGRHSGTFTPSGYGYDAQYFTYEVSSSTEVKITAVGDSSANTTLMKTGLSFTYSSNGLSVTNITLEVFNKTYSTNHTYIFNA